VRAEEWCVAGGVLRGWRRGAALCMTTGLEPRCMMQGQRIEASWLKLLEAWCVARWLVRGWMRGGWRRRGLATCVASSVVRGSTRGVWLEG
jgi:hypothetical protein